MKTPVSIFMLLISSAFFSGIANFPATTLYAASRQMPIGLSELGTTCGKGGSAYGKKQNAETRPKKGKGFFKRLFAYGKWKKELRSSEKIEPGRLSMISLIVSIGLTLLSSLAPGLSLLGLLLLVAALVLGKYAKKNSTGKDKKIGEICMKIATGILIFYAVMLIITVIGFSIFLAAIA